MRCAQGLVRGRNNNYFGHSPPTRRRAYSERARGLCDVNHQATPAPVNYDYYFSSVPPVPVRVVAPMSQTVSVPTDCVYIMHRIHLEPVRIFRCAAGLQGVDNRTQTRAANIQRPPIAGQFNEIMQKRCVWALSGQRTLCPCIMK